MQYNGFAEINMGVRIVIALLPIIIGRVAFGWIFLTSALKRGGFPFAYYLVCGSLQFVISSPNQHQYMKLIPALIVRVLYSPVWKQHYLTHYKERRVNARIENIWKTFTPARSTEEGRLGVLSLHKEGDICYRHRRHGARKIHHGQGHPGAVGVDSGRIVIGDVDVTICEYSGPVHLARVQPIP